MYHTQIFSHLFTQDIFLCFRVVVNAMHVVQMKVLLRERWKLLLLMICLSLNIMTSQSHTSVQCVINGFLQNGICRSIFKRTLNRNHICVLGVRSVIIIARAWQSTWIFTAVNTSAVNVESVSIAMLFNHTHTNLFGRETAWVFSLWQTIYTGRNPCCARQNSQWRESIQIQRMWKVFSTKYTLDNT